MVLLCYLPKHKIKPVFKSNNNDVRDSGAKIAILGVNVKFLSLNTKYFHLFLLDFFFFFFTLFSFCQQKNYDEADEDCKHGEKQFKSELTADTLTGICFIMWWQCVSREHCFKLQVVTCRSPGLAAEIKNFG